MGNRLTYDKLFASAASEWPTSSTIDWRNGEYLYVLFHLDVPRATLWQRFIASWAIPNVAFSIPEYGFAEQSDLCRNVIHMVQYGGELITKHINQSNGIAVPFALRLLWSLCIPLFLLLKIWISAHPPLDDLSTFIPVFMCYLTVIMLPFFLAYRVKRKIKQVLCLCNEELSIKYGLHHNDLFMFLEHKSSRHFDIIMAVRYRNITNHNDDVCNHNITNHNDDMCNHERSIILVDGTNDVSSELDLIAPDSGVIEQSDSDNPSSMQPFVSIPFVNETLDNYFKSNISRWRDSLASFHPRWKTPLFHLCIGINWCCSFAIPCSPHMSNVSSYPPLLSSSITKTTYDRLSQHFLQSMSMSVVLRLIVCSMPAFVVAAIALLASGTLKLSVESMLAVKKSLILVCLMLFPFLISHIVTALLELRVKSLVDYFNDEHANQSLRLVYRFNNHRHLELYFITSLQSIGEPTIEGQLNKKSACAICLDDKFTEYIVDEEPVADQIDSS